MFSLNIHALLCHTYFDICVLSVYALNNSIIYINQTPPSWAAICFTFVLAAY